MKCSTGVASSVVPKSAVNADCSGATGWEDLEGMPEMSVSGSEVRSSACLRTGVKLILADKRHKTGETIGHQSVRLGDMAELGNSSPGR